MAEAAAAIRLASAAASDAQRSAARPGVSPAAAAADSAGFHSRCSFVSPLDFCFRVALARSVALPLLVISAYEGLHCSCLRSTDSSPAILFEFLALVSCLPTMRFHSLCLLPFLWQSSAGFIFLFAMAVALVPVPQCFYWLRLLPYLWQFSGCDTMRFYSP